MLREKFLAAASEWNLGEPDTLTDDAPLAAADGFDSLTLFKLILWVEEQTGETLDPTGVDLTEAWATVGDFLRFASEQAHRDQQHRPKLEFEPRSRASVSRTVTLRGRRYQIIDFAPEHADKVAALQMFLWSPDQALNRRYLEWKYLLNPYRAGSRIFLAICGDQVVAMRGFYGADWQLRNEEQVERVLMADDLMVHPEHRNVGLYEHLMAVALDELRIAGVPGVLNLSSNPSNALASLSTGWSKAGRFLPMRVVNPSGLASLRRLVNARPVVWRLKRRMFTRRERAPFCAMPSVAVPTVLDGRITIESDPRIAEMTQLVADNAHSGRLRQVRDETFFRWRLQNPLSDYRYFFADVDGELAGYLVLRTLSKPVEPSGEVSVVDYEVRDDSVLEGLLVAALHQRFPELVVWSGSMSQTQGAIVRDLGFEPCPGDPLLPDWPCALVHRLQSVDSASLFADTVTLDGDAWDMRPIYSMRG